MILPKGTLEFQQSGGKDAISDVIEKIRGDGLTGYVLVLGKVEVNKGKEDDITAQMVFKEGGAVLCETVLNKKSIKGNEGIYHMLLTMMNEEASIEFRSKIDVEPPIAFFKECSIEDSLVNVPAFMERYQQEEEKRRKEEEERRKREELREEWKEKIEEWLTSGFDFPSYPDIFEKDFNELSKWFEGISSNIAEIKEDLEWLIKIEDVEVEEKRGELIDIMKRPEEIGSIRKEMDAFKEELQGVEEKRKEIIKWVNLWKDEGYNTDKIEANLKESLETAWNAMTQFMDDIQKLKDAKEELEKLKEMDDSKGFGAEIREIDFLLNDPEELENINGLMDILKETIQKEREEKENILEKAKEIEDGGFDISSLRSRIGSRLSDFEEHFQMLQKNFERISEIREEVEGFDRRDIPDEIEAFLSDTTDPTKLEEYEERLEDLKEKLKILGEKRKLVLKDMESWASEGYVVTILEENMDAPVDRLETYREELLSGINELKGLKENIAQMDQQWLEDEFGELEDMLKDPSKIDDIKEKTKELAERIETRESKRGMVKTDLDIWSKEGFVTERLEEVIDKDEPEFSRVHLEIKERINESKDLLSRLDSMDPKFFAERAADARLTILDPFELEAAKEMMGALFEDMTRDKEMRDDFRKRIAELEEGGWNVEGLESILEMEPDTLGISIEEVENKVKMLQEAENSIEKWDQLESKWLASEIEELKVHLKNIPDTEAALSHHDDLRSKLEDNRTSREQTKKKLVEWKDIGYITRSVENLVEEGMEKLSVAFDLLKKNIDRLEEMQSRFDSLDTKHFKAEAEDIEFKLNDPDLVDDIEMQITNLQKKIEEDRKVRDEYLRKIESYVGEGFTGAEKLKEFIDEEITIVDLEFKNFQKEVELFKKYMEKVGFVPKAQSSKKEK
ncbi:MAG: hypothetical protein ACMUIE_03455 [Thermoplasmatota archaeon]